MKMKKWIASVGALMMTVAISTTALATDTAKLEGFFGKSKVPSNTKRHVENAQQEDMDAKKEQMKAKMNEMMVKWDALPKEKKEEVFLLKDKAADIEKQVIDKYVEFGVMDEATGNEIKARMDEYKVFIRENGNMPLFGGKGMKGNGSQPTNKPNHTGQPINQPNQTGQPTNQPNQTGQPTNQPKQMSQPSQTPKTQDKKMNNQ